jgi:hypothetical protein
LDHKDWTNTKKNGPANWTPTVKNGLAERNYHNSRLLEALEANVDF